MTRVSLLDADSYVWVAAYHNKDGDQDEKMLNDLDDFILSLLRNVRADKYAGFIKGNNPTFRHIAFKDYKAQRPEVPQYVTRAIPIVKNHLISKWKFQTVDKVEVDDAISSAHSILSKVPEYVPIICSRDKDFKQISGYHYDPKKKEETYVSIEEARVNLLLQLLTGDVVDNIKGIAGIGPVKGLKALQSDPEHMERVVVDMYLKEAVTPLKGLIRLGENLTKVKLLEDETFQFTLNDFPYMATPDGSLFT